MGQAVIDTGGNIGANRRERVWARDRIRKKVMDRVKSRIVNRLFSKVKRNVWELIFGRVKARGIRRINLARVRIGQWDIS